MSEGVADGNAVPAESMFPPGFISCQNSSAYNYDPAAARQLLADAGYQDVDGDGIVEKDGKALELVLQTYPEQPLLPPMLEAMQSMLRDIGIGAKVQIVEWTLASQGGYDLFGYSNGTITTGDPQWALTRQYLTGGDENRGNFSNARVDELIGQLSAASEPACLASSRNGRQHSSFGRYRMTPIYMGRSSQRVRRIRRSSLARYPDRRCPYCNSSTSQAESDWANLW